MDWLTQVFGEVEDLTGTLSIADIAVALVGAFLLCALVGCVYRITHRGVSYSQSYVQTLVLMGMVVALIMMIVGSNIARAFSLVGALSIIRFRNARQGDARRRVHLLGDGHRHGRRHQVLHPGRGGHRAHRA